MAMASRAMFIRLMSETVKFMSLKNLYIHGDYTHARAHAHTHTHTHSYIHPQPHLYARTHTYTHTNLYYYKARTISIPFTSQKCQGSPCDM